MWKTPCFFLLLLACQLPATAQDMRADHIKARQKQEAVLGRAQAAAHQAELEAEQSRQAILADKNALNQAINELEKKTARLKQQRYQVFGICAGKPDNFFYNAGNIGISRLTLLFFNC